MCAPEMSGPDFGPSCSCVKQVLPSSVTTELLSGPGRRSHGRGRGCEQRSRRSPRVPRHSDTRHPPATPCATGRIRGQPARLSSVGTWVNTKCCIDLGSLDGRRSIPRDRGRTGSGVWAPGLLLAIAVLKPPGATARPVGGRRIRPSHHRPWGLQPGLARI